MVASFERGWNRRSVLFAHNGHKYAAGDSAVEILVTGSVWRLVGAIINFNLTDCT